METRKLTRAPAILPLYARAAAPLLPGSSLLPFLGGRGGELPAIELALAGVAVDRDRLAAYAHVCGFSLRDTLPATYPQVLAFPLTLALMTDRRFPYPAAGLVHIANRIVQHRPVHVGEALDLTVFASHPRAHARGRTFGLVANAHTSASGELVWESESTMLHRGGGGGNGGGGDDDNDRGNKGGDDDSGSGGQNGGGSAPHEPDTRDEPQEPAPALPPPSAQWRLPGDLGRRYAAVSGDRNPIHMHALTAKAFGFRRAIAHGMWTKARCLAALEGSLPDAYAVEVHFRRPIELPATVAFAEARTGAAIDFHVRDAKRQTPHLDGHLQPAGAGDDEPGPSDYGFGAGGEGTGAGGDGFGAGDDGAGVGGAGFGAGGDRAGASDDRKRDTARKEGSTS
jgi:acyl dehydratase